MAFSSFSDALWMSGHGGYVWGVFGISIVLLVLLTLYPIHAHKQLLQQVSVKERRKVAQQKNINGDDAGEQA